MKQENSGFQLWVEGKEFSDGLVTGFSDKATYRTLKEAFLNLQRIGNIAFDSDMVALKSLPRWFEDAIIKDLKDNTVVMAKYSLQSNDVQGMPAGVYMRRNTKKISHQEFQQLTGYILDRFARYGQDDAYYLLASSAQLQRQHDSLQQKAHKPNNKIGNSSRKGFPGS